MCIKYSVFQFSHLRFDFSKDIICNHFFDKVNKNSSNFFCIIFWFIGNHLFVILSFHTSN